MQGRCSNLPNMGRCTKADTGELIDMIGDDPRCPECGLPLQEAKGARGTTVSLPKKPGTKWLVGAGIAAALIAVVVIAMTIIKPGAGRYDMVLSGSNSIGGELAPEMVEAWLTALGYEDITNKPYKITEKDPKDGQIKSHPAFDISGKKDGKRFMVGIRAAGTATGFKEAKLGNVDIIMASRGIKAEEVSALASQGDFSTTAAEHVIAYDGIAIIVAPGNPVKQLTLHQVHDIFTGQIADWGEVGGLRGHSIKLYARDDNSGTYDGFKSRVLNNVPLAKAKRYEDSKLLEADVASDPDGIGFVAMSYVKSAIALPISSGASDYFMPTTFTVRTDRYPLSRRLYLYSAPQNVKPAVEDFLRFAESDAGQAVPTKLKMVGLSLVGLSPPPLPEIGRCTLSSAWPNPNAYCEIIARTKIQPIVFKFRNGSDELDSLAIADLRRLLSLLEANSGKTVVLVGHTDDVGDFWRNVKLSKNRAESVAKALRTLGWERTQIDGFGEDIPSEPNDTDHGRASNRRVDVFLQ